MKAESSKIQNKRPKEYVVWNLLCLTVFGKNGGMRDFVRVSRLCFVDIIIFSARFVTCVSLQMNCK